MKEHWALFKSSSTAVRLSPHLFCDRSVHPLLIVLHILIDWIL